jgi:hypothetical protein
MPQPNDLSRSLVALDQNSTIIAVVERNRERLIEGDISRKFMAAVLNQGQVKALLSDHHFSVDATLIEAWASMKSFRPKDGSGEPLAAGRNGERDFHGEKRCNQTHASTTDPDCPAVSQGAGPARQACLSGACSDGEPARSGGRHAANLGHR